MSAGKRARARAIQYRGRANGYDTKSYVLRTQQEVADLLGCTRARVMQIERGAMRKLRRALGAEVGS